MTEPAFRATTPIHALSRYPDHLDIFAVALADNHVTTIRWDAHGGWTEWVPATDGLSSPGGHGSPVTAVARYSDHVDLFTVDPANHPITASWSKRSGLSTWSPVGPTGPSIPPMTCRPGSTVNVVSRYSDHLDVFTTDDDDRVVWAHWTAQGGWERWDQVEGGIASPGATVTAVTRHPAHLNVFVPGLDNSVFHCWWDFRSGWHDWNRIGPVGAVVCRPDATVTAVARHRDQMDLFTTASDGRIMTNSWNRRDRWHAWTPIPGCTAAPGSDVTAIARSCVDLDLFVVGSDDKVYSTSWHEPGPWKPWFNVSGGASKPGGQVGAVSRHTGRMEIFTVGADDGITTCSWDPSTNWGSWRRVPPA